MVRCYTCKYYILYVTVEKNTVTARIDAIWNKYCQRKEQLIQDAFGDIQCECYDVQTF